MTDPMLGSIALAFFGVMGLEFAWARYTIAVREHHILPASWWALVAFVAAGLVTLTYVQDWHMLIPAAAGAFIGTLAGMKFTT